MLGVLHSKLLKGCSSLKGEENLQYFKNNCMSIMPLEEMLATQFNTDAHFACYRITDYPMWPRLNKPILSEIRQEGFDVVLGYFAFDWDNDNHAEWNEQNLAVFAEKIQSISSDPILSQWASIYTTEHGARIIYRVSKPMPVDDGEQHLAWMIHRFEQAGLSKIDSACKDWTRLMRCPQVIRDNKATWEQPYYSIVNELGRTLDINTVGKRSTATIAKKTYFVREHQEMPSYDALQTQLFTINKATQKTVQTEYFKRAKRVLKNSEYFDILFNDASPSWLTGQRNNQMMLMLGIITPILLKRCNATPAQIYALAVNPLLTLEQDRPWVEDGWNALLDIYEREVNKFNLEKEEQAQKVSVELDILDAMCEGMKTWNEHPILWGTDSEAAREYIKKNIMATAQNYFFLLGKDGFYEDFAVTRDTLISRIRKTHLNDIIPTEKLAITGDVTDVTSTSLQNDYSTPVMEIVMKPVGAKGGFIEDMNGRKPKLVLSTFCRNDLLEPTFDPFVDEWLKNLFGVNYETGCEWIANSLAFDEGLISALSLEGASSAGKKLLTIGLSECLVDCPFPAGPEDVYGQSSAFLRTPFLVINEFWPTKSGVSSPADIFKTLTGGEGIPVNEKYKPRMMILCPVRMILTANNSNIVKELTNGRDMSLDDRIAVGERLLHFKVSEKAKLFLDSIGGRDFTAAEGQRWIRPDSGLGKSDFIVAKHFLWLYHNRTRTNTAQRFLVMGNSAPGAGGNDMTVFEKLLADSNCTPQVAEAVIKMADNMEGHWKPYIRTNQEQTHIWVTRFGVHKYVKEILEQKNIQDRDTFSGLQNILAKSEPDIWDNMHWYMVDIDALAMIATERGIKQTFIRNVQMNRITLKEREMIK